MNKQRGYFYTHLISIEALFIELDTLDLSDDERHHLGKLIDSNLHHTVLEVILSELNEEDKEYFLRLVAAEKHDTIWEHLNGKVDNIEEKIKITAKELVEKMHKDIRDAKRLKGGK